MILSINNQKFHTQNKYQSPINKGGSKTNNPSFGGRLCCTEDVGQILRDLKYAGATSKQCQPMEKMLTAETGVLDQMAKLFGVDIEISSCNLYEGSRHCDNVSKFDIKIKNDASHSKRRFNDVRRTIIVQNGLISQKAPFETNARGSKKWVFQAGTCCDIATAFKVKCDEMLKPLVDMFYGTKT